jgi:type VI secretion system protein ImpE
MTADEFFKAGQLGDAIDAQTQIVKKKPTDDDARFMLFVLLAYAGELDRADKQLDVLANMDDKIRTGTMVYHSLLASELERSRVFSGESKPVFPPDSPASLDLRLQALGCLRSGDAAAAEAKADEADEQTPPCSGKLNGKDFDDFRNYDDVLGHVFEIYAGGRYLWMAMSQIRSLEISAPETAIDTLWRQAKLTDSDGTVADVHLPVVYAGSSTHADEAVRLGRITDWVEQGNLFTGVGQHLYATTRGDDQTETSLLDIHSLEINA